MDGLRCRNVTVAPGGAVVLRDIDLDVAPGTLTVLVGPSGVGKTTLVRAVAGLVPVRTGRIELGGRDLTGVPAHGRRLAVVFQEPRLFPNFDVADNVAFGLRVAGVRKAERRERARALLDEVGLAGLAQRSVLGLSGGEQQRVALARALSVDPELLLLDEPLSSIDPERRGALRELIASLQRARRLTTLYVTHDQEEAAELGDAVALLLEGRIVQHGPPRELFERPKAPAVARFFGNRNLLEGEVTGGRLVLGAGEVTVPGPDGPACLTIRPERIAIAPTGTLDARVEDVTYHGTFCRVRLDAGGVPLEAHQPPDAAPPVGSTVRIDLPRQHLWRFPTTAAVRTTTGGAR